MSGHNAESSPTFGEATAVWWQIALQSFGGPAAQIAVMHRVIVEEKKWVDEARFLHALNYCMLLPGPEAQQLATYLGWLLHGTRGGLLAGGLFILPGAVAMLLLSALYAAGQGLTWVDGLLYGLKAAVLAVVIEAVLRIGRRVLKNRVMVGIAISGFLAIFAFQIPFPAIVLGAGAVGALGGRLRPDLFVVLGGAATAATGQRGQGWGRAIRVLALGLLLWFGPVLAFYRIFGPDNTLVQLATFFSRAAVVTFGGAYAVLAYVAQQAVEHYGWLQPGQMMDGLGLAETTPGPLILVLEFVGFQAGYHHAGMNPWLGGLLGAGITLWVTFVPSFLWILLGAPTVEALRGRRGLSAALSAITAAVVGVVLNLAVWFGLHVLFTPVGTWRAGPLSLPSPAWRSLDPVAAILGIGAAAALLRFHVRLSRVLVGSALLGLAWRLLGAPR